MRNDAAAKHVAWVTAAMVALFLLAGRWSIARVGMGEPSILLEPRAWSVVGLVAIAYSPALTRTLHHEPSLGSGLGTIVLFLGYMTATVLWAPSSDLPWTKAYEMVLVALVLVSVARIARWTRAAVLINRFWDVLAISLGLMAVLGLTSWAGGEGERLAVLGGGPNVFGRNMAVLMMLGLASILSGRSKRGLWIAAAVMGALLALLSGSRGAIVGMMAGGSALVLAKRLPIGRFVKIAIGLAIAGWFVVSFTEVGQSALTSFEERFVILTLEERHDAGRMGIYAHAWTMGRNAPLIGQGLAAFAVSGFHVYPHNIVLESFCEGGTLGVVLLVSVLVPPFRRALGAGSNEVARDIAVFVVLLVSAMFTGDLFDSRGVLVVAAMMSFRRRQDVLSG